MAGVAKAARFAVDAVLSPFSASASTASL
jgi:hypothetical protein